MIFTLTIANDYPSYALNQALGLLKNLYFHFSITKNSLAEVIHSVKTRFFFRTTYLSYVRFHPTWFSDSFLSVLHLLRSANIPSIINCITTDNLQRLYKLLVQRNRLSSKAMKKGKRRQICEKKMLNHSIHYDAIAPKLHLKNLNSLSIY